MIRRQQMRGFSRISRACDLATVGVLVSLWLGLSGLLAVSRGKPEAFLATTFGRFGRADAFEHLNGVAILIWSVHSILVLIAIAATRYRRTDVLAVLMIGPVFAASIVLPVQRWPDPNWHEVVSVCSIGWLVGSVVSCGYWVLKLRRVRRDTTLRQTRPTA